jgi:hypothetical protein
MCGARLEIQETLPKANCEVHRRLLNMTLTCPFAVAIAMTQKFAQVDA